MKNKIIDSILLISFLLFAIVQYNDADSFMWIVTYLLIASLALMALMNKLNTFHAAIITGIFTFLLISNINLLSEWNSAGRPAFIDYQPTEIDAVEAIREYLGLFICFSASLYYTLSKRFKKT